jgi:serine/threonine-protein kinase
MSGIPAGAGQLLGKRLGKYEILALLALGGTAEIYLARIGGTAGFEKYVVVKCLHDHLADDAEFVKMFLDEARLAAHLDHSNIVQTMELGQHEGRYYMVMEFLAGLSLAMIVRRAAERLPNSRIPVPLVLNILAQSCAGLHYAHEKAMNGKPLNIVHRDISPQNLVISFEGVVKVVDFGIAKAELRETRTRSGTIKGKFAYMSPEQCVANNVDRRTDVFALGVIGHELLTGRRLFKRTSPYETYQAVIECDVKPPSTFDTALDPAVDAVIMRATAKDKEARYPTAEAFGDALLGYLHHRGIGSGPGDVSRFFDAHFAQEIDEHSGRMRELISGRDISVETGVTWGADDGDDEAKREAAAEKARQTTESDGSQPQAGESGNLDAAKHPSAGSLSLVLDDLGGGSRVEDDDEMPAERTRIESNPLGKINELDKLASRAPVKPSPVKPSPAKPSSAKPSPAKPSPAKPFPAPSLPPSGAVALPAPPPGPAAPKIPAGMPPSGRFPDLANLPTMIAEPEPPANASHAASGDPGFTEVPTDLLPSSVPPAASGFTDAPTDLALSGALHAAGGLANAPTALANAPLSALAGTQVAPLPMGKPGHAQPPSAYPGRAQPNGGPGLGAHASPQVSIPPASIPQGYPVMNAQLSAQIATGATVFPSDHRGNQPQPAPLSAPPAVPPSAPHPGPRSPEPSGMHDSYPQMAPPARVPDSGPAPAHHGNLGGSLGNNLTGNFGGSFSDPQRAANVMSPGTPPYLGSTPWAAATFSRVRAAPPWLLALLFVGALGIALALTIVIARLIR